MATTELLFNGNASTTEFQYTFPSITASTDIKAAIDAGDGNGHVDTAAFTLLTSPTRVKFNSAPASGTNNIKIYRETSVETATAVFAAGSAIRAADLNNNFDQLLYSSQDQDRDVATEDLKNLAVTTPKIAADAIDGTKIADDSINSEHYVNDSIDTAHIADDQVTYAKIQNVSTTDRILGRDSSGAGVIEEIAPSALRTMINVEDGATADQTAAEIRTLVGSATDSQVFTDADHTKLDGIEVSATADQTNAEIRAAVEAATDSNVFTDNDHTKLNGIAAGAEVNVQSDWNASSGDAQILNKPSIVAVGGTDGVDFNDGVKARWGTDNDLEIYHDNSTGHSWIKELGANELKIASTPQIGIISADASKTAATFNTDGGSCKLFHNNTAKFETSATGATLSGALVHELAAGKIHLGDANGDAAPVTISGDATLANTGALTIAANAVEIGMIGCEQTGGNISASDSHIPTSKAVTDYVTAQLNNIGGFVPIDDDQSFPNANPDPDNNAGTVVSIDDAGGLVIRDGSGSGTYAGTAGTSVTGRAADSSVVTITGIPASLQGTTIGAGKGMLVQTTSTLHTYTYHRLIIDEAGVASASTLVTDFNNRYRTGTNKTADNSDTNDDGDLFFDQTANKMYVYDGEHDSGGSWKEVTSAGDYKLLGIKNHDQAHNGSGPTYGSGEIEYDLFDGTSDASIINAGQLLVVLNGVLQKPNSGTYSNSEEGFYLNDTHGIKFCTAPPANSTLFVTQIGTGTTLSVPADDSVTSAKIENGAVTTGKIANNAVDGTKIAIGSDASGDIIYYNGTDYTRLAKGTDGEVLKLASGAPSWDTAGSGTITWTLGINGGANAFTFTGDGFASATDDPTLYVTRGQTYKFVNGNSSGTHAFNIQSYDYDGTGTSYTTGMTNAGATGGNTMTWVVPMDAPRNLQYVSGTTASMTGDIIVSETEGAQGFRCTTGSTTKGLLITNGVNSNTRMAQFGLIDGGTAPAIYGSGSNALTIIDTTSTTIGNGNVTLKSYGTNSSTPATMKFEGGGNNTYGPTISGPATAQATSDYTITLPGVVPSASGQALTATTAGVCSWTTISTDSDKIIEGDTSIECTDSGSDGAIEFKIDNQSEIKLDNDGKLLLGLGGQYGPTKNGMLQLYGHAAGNSAPQIDLKAKRDSAQMTTDNVIGAINFWARDDNSVTSEEHIAQIEVEADGSWGASSWPTKMLFKVTPPDNSDSPPGNQLQEVLRLQGNNYAQVHFGGDYYYGHGNKMFYSVDDTTSLPNYGSLTFGGDNNNNTTASHKRVWFESDVGQQGGIKTTHNATSFETSSDYRLKKDQVDITDGIAKVKQLKPYRFKWKNDKDGSFHDGFFAHEVAEVLPTGDAISGTKDQVYDILYSSGDPDREKDGKEVGDIKVKDAIDPQSMDYGRITPILTAALKEAIAKIETLETKVAALEAG